MKLHARLPAPVFGALFGALTGLAVWGSMRVREGPEVTAGPLVAGIGAAVAVTFAITALTSARAAAPLRRALAFAGSALLCLGGGGWAGLQLLQGQLVAGLGGCFSALFFGVMAWRISRGEDPADIVARGSVSATRSATDER